MCGYFEHNAGKRIAFLELASIFNQNKHIKQNTTKNGITKFLKNLLTNIREYLSCLI